MNVLTQEQLCELNNIRNEIEKMECITDFEKLEAVSDVLRAVLEFYSFDYTIATARHRLERCRAKNAARRL